VSKLQLIFFNFFLDLRFVLLISQFKVYNLILLLLRFQLLGQ